MERRLERILTDILLKHAVILDNKVTNLLKEKDVSDASLLSINDGIRMITYTLTTIEKAKRLHQCDTALEINEFVPTQTNHEEHQQM